ncbi:MAG TPA: PDZ domain-containing protein [Lacipirellulaceae bacterium]|nr:PDZ domain-containing protein [Lacipirellulaceae bacterium]
MRKALKWNLVQVALCVAGFWRAAYNREAFASDEGAVIASFSVFDDGDAVIVPVTFRGAAYGFSVDSASTRVTYDASFTSLLGDPIDYVATNTLTGVQQRPVFDAPDAHLGRLSLRSRPPVETRGVTCRDLALTRLATGHDIRGCLGMDFLKRHIIRLDFNHGKLLFLTRVGTEPGVLVRMARGQSDPAVVSTIPGLAPVAFAISTGGGCNSGVLDATLIDELLQRKLAVIVREGTIVEGNQAAPTRIVRVNSIELGGFQQRALLFGERSGGRGNALDLGFWRRFVVTIDFPNRALYLKPSKWHDAPDDDYFGAIERIGMGIGILDGDVTIRFVNPGSPAQRGGIRKMDVLAAIGGFDVSHARLLTIYRLLFTAKNPIRLTIDRGGERLELSVNVPRSNLHSDLGR